MLDYVSSPLVDHETKNMQVCVSVCKGRVDLTLRNHRSPQTLPYIPGTGGVYLALRTRLPSLFSRARFQFGNTFDL
jgi:hypothetical protein